MFASLALMLAVAAGEQPSTPPPSKPKLICRGDQRELGSHIHTGRRCKTPEDWRIDDARLDQIPPTMRVTEGQNDGHPPPPPPHL